MLQLFVVEHERNDLLVPLRTRSAYFSSVDIFFCGIVRETKTVHFFDFNICATLTSFILFGKWLESRAKASTEHAIASMLALQVPTALLVEEEDGVLDEREISQIALRVHSILFGVEHNNRYETFVQTMIQFEILLRHEVIVHCTLFGVEHDERYETLVQTMIQIGISLPAIKNSSRHEVFVHCSLFAVEHDKCSDLCVALKSISAKSSWTVASWLLSTIS